MTGEVKGKATCMGGCGDNDLMSGAGDRPLRSGPTRGGQGGFGMGVR